MLPPQIANRARPPRLGVIRLGVKVPYMKDGKPVVRQGQPVTIPQEVDYFVLPDTLRAALGDQPKTLRVLFPFDDPDEVLTASFKLYAGALLTLKCDGRTVTEFPKEGGATTTGPCRRPDIGVCACGATAKGTLHVVVIDGPVGIYHVLIGGEQRLADLWTELRVYRRLFGRLTDIPFTLERVPQEVQITKADGGRLAKTGWPVRVRCAFSVADALRARHRDLAALPDTIETTAVEEDDDADDVDPDESPRQLEAPKPDPTPSHPAPEEPWTVERCYAVATACGIESRDFAKYLLHTYKTTDIDLGALAQVIDLVQSIQNSPKAAASFKAHVARLTAR